MRRKSNTRRSGRTLGVVSTVMLALALSAGLGCRSVMQPVRLPKGSPELHVAVAGGAGAEVDRLAKADPNVRGPLGWTALHVAAIHDRPSMAKKLLEAKADVNAMDRVSMTPLHWAARKGNGDVVEALLAGGADVAARNKFDMTPLHEAGSERIARLLLDAKAQIMARDMDGMTPLHTAPNKKVAELLIDRGADINARAKDGRTPLQMPPMATPRISEPGSKK